MAFVLPHSFQGNSPAEDDVWRLFGQYLGDGIVSFHNYFVCGREMDVLVLYGGLGVLSIEIKGHLAKNITAVLDNTGYSVRNEPAVPSPFLRAIRCQRSLFNLFSANGLQSVYIVPCVCYPYITAAEYEACRLNKISPLCYTITKDDLADQHLLQNKLRRMFETAYSEIRHPLLQKYGFDAALMNRAANLISPGYNESVRPQPEAARQPATPPRQKRTHYSRLVYLQDGGELTSARIQSLADDWAAGTKIQFYSPDTGAIANVAQALEAKLAALGLSSRKAFQPRELERGNRSGFLYDVCQCAQIGPSFEIMDGAGADSHLDALNRLHDSSSFNSDQYLTEHASLTDIIVKAGAGTGKTHSLISRINYLIWRMGYHCAGLADAVVMITFTNESTNQMKEKLRANFLNHYLLTMDIGWLGFAECVEDMRICTIHSLSKRLLQRYGSLLGLGHDFSVSGSDFRRRQLLQKHLGRFLTQNKNFADKAGMTMFHLQQRLARLLELMDNKNIDLAGDNLDFGACQNKNFTRLVQLLREEEEEFRQELNGSNTVSLGSFIKQLKQLRARMESGAFAQPKPVDFLFVDEFQDTDDVQIELMKGFQPIFGYKFFVVGDVKQCIYRFRGAEVMAFSTLDRSGSYSNFSLRKNYRTDKGLMERFNGIFSHWDEAEWIGYKAADRLTGTKALTEEPLMIRRDSPKGRFEEELAQCLEECRQQAEGRTAILVRFNSQVEKVKAICAGHGIDVETDIGGELFQIDPTIDLMKLVQALRYSQDPKYLYGLYTTSYTRDPLPKAGLWPCGREEAVKLFYQKPPVSKWPEYLASLRAEPVLKVIRKIVNDVLPWEIFADKSEDARQGPNRMQAYERRRSFYLRNLDQLFEDLIVASNTDYLTIHKISDYLETMILSRQEKEARESFDVEKTNSPLICTTVHKSKGLEFDTVILPYCGFSVACERDVGDVDLIYDTERGNRIGYRICGDDDGTVIKNNHYDELIGLEKSDRMKEEVRILYVAMTRTIRRLIYFTGPGDAGGQCWRTMMQR